jgi:hypothetical protein
MHTHLVTCQVMGRTPFDAEAYEKSTTPGGGGVPGGIDLIEFVTGPEGAARIPRARLQGHGQGEPRLPDQNPGQVRATGRCDGAPGLRLPLPHRRARGQRHDEAVHGHAVASCAENDPRSFFVTRRLDRLRKASRQIAALDETQQYCFAWKAVLRRGILRGRCRMPRVTWGSHCGKSRFPTEHCLSTGLVPAPEMARPI